MLQKTMYSLFLAKEDVYRSLVQIVERAIEH